MTDVLWQPSADLSALQARAQLNSHIRRFFSERQVLEVEVPLLASCAVTDPFIDSISVNYGGEACGVKTRQLYLQTSPEFFMKRLLAAGSGAIYSLGKAFRNGEAGHRHNPEFTMLEWYRPGFDDQQLKDEVEALLAGLLELSVIERLSYRELFQRYLQIDPHRLPVAELKQLAQSHITLELDDDHRDTWLDLLMTHIIEPQLQQQRGLVLVYDYPASQCALAAFKPMLGTPVAKR